MSGQQIGTVVGGVVGTFVPVIGTAVGMAVGGAIGGLIAPEKLPDQYGPRLPDSKVTVSTFGNMVQRFYGNIRGAGQVIFSTPQQEVPEEDTSGKGGPVQKTTTYSYKRSFAISLGEGPIIGVNKILADTKLIFNNSENASVGTLIASHKNGNIRIYLGTEDQLPDPFIQAFAGIDKTSAYRGTAYVMFEDFFLGEFGNRLPNFEFEIVQKGKKTSTIKIVSALTSPSGRNMILVNDKAYDFNTDVYDDYKTKVRFFKVLKDDNRMQPLGGEYVLPEKYFASAPYIIKSDDDSIVFLQRDSENYFHFYSMKIDTLIETSGNAVTDTASSTSDLSTLYKFGKEVDEELRNPWISIHAYVNKYNYQVVCGRSGFAESVYTLSVLNRNISPNSFNYKVPVDLVLTDMDISQNYIYTVENNKVYRYNLYLTNKIVYFETTEVKNICVVNDNQIYIYGQTNGTTGVFEISSGVGKAVRTGITTDADNMSFDGINFFFKYQNKEQISTDTYVAEDTKLSEIVTSICKLANYDLGEFDVSKLNQDVHGYMLTRIDSAAGNLKPLAQTYFFDLIENDDVLQFVNRGSDVVADIPASDMSAHAYNSETPDNLEIMRKQETDLVNELTVQYYDIDSGFQIGAQFARRNTGTSYSVNASSVQLPLSLTANEAATKASIMLDDYWQTRHSFIFYLSNKYAYLTPTDVVRVEKDGTYYTVRILEIEEQNGLFKITACSEDKTKYSQKSAGAILPAAKQEIEQAIPTNFQMMDIPLLRDEDEQKGIYVAATGYSKNWRGALLNKSSDGGVSFSSTGNIYSKKSVIGYTKTVLQDFFSGNIFDESSFVDVFVYDAELVTTTEMNVLNGANAALIGNEIIQFKRAQFLSQNNYRISGFIRGKRGTEWRMSTHAINERFILLDSTKMSILPMPSSEYDMLRYYKAVSFNETVNDADTIAFQNTGMAQECYSPVHLGGGKNGSNDFILNWVRRGRLNNEWNNKIDVPIGESVEAYEIEILSGNTVKRVISSSTNTALYTSAQQIEDFGANQTIVKFRVYQISTLRGRGIPATKTI